MRKQTNVYYSPRYAKSGRKRATQEEASLAKCDGHDEGLEIGKMRGRNSTRAETIVKNVEPKLAASDVVQTSNTGEQGAHSKRVRMDISRNEENLKQKQRE